MSSNTMVKPLFQKRARVGFPVPVLLLLSGLLLALLLQAAIVYLLLDSLQWSDYLWMALSVITLISITLVGAGMIYMRRHIFQPLAKLRDWAFRSRAHDISLPISEHQNQELGEVAGDINGIINRFQTVSTTMETKASEQAALLAQKSKSLEVLYDIATSVSESEDLSGLLTRFLATLKDLVGAQAACVRLLTTDKRMCLVGSIGLDDKFVEQEKFVPMGQCMCGDVAKSGVLSIKEDLHGCGILIKDSKVSADKLKMVVVPLQYRGQILGLYNLIVDEKGLSGIEGNDDLLRSIGRHLGVAIKKSILHEESDKLLRMEERALLANELHDSFAQTLAALRFQVRGLDETLHGNDECAVWEELERVEDSLDEANRDLRELIAYFRKPSSDYSIVPGIEAVVSRFRRDTDISIFLQNQWTDALLPKDTEKEVVRIIQEALANVRKHSNAQSARVMLRNQSDGSYQVLIEDDGVGYGEPVDSGNVGEHIGLTIMEERAQRINGTLSIDSEPGEGTHVLLEFHHQPEERMGLPLGLVARL
ncbi:histidine kinase [Pseudomonadota bacterium]